MTNYKRFISYLYYYENGQKKGNVGFARVESSNELCKITVHCTLKSVPKKLCKIYLLRRQTSLIRGEEVGAAEVINGVLDAKLSFERGTIVPKEFEFKDCIGIVFLYSKDNYIGAKWDESAITYHEASLIEQSMNKEKKSDRIESNDTQKEEELPQEKPKMQDGVPRWTEKLETPIKEEPEKSEESITSSQNFDIEKSAIPIREILNKKAMLQMIPEEDIKVIDTNEKNKEASSLSEELKKEIVVEKPEDNKEVTSINDSEVHCESISKQESQVMNEEVDREVDEDRKEADITNEEEEIVTVTGGSAAAALNMSQWVDHPAARAILNRFVRMYPFDDGEIAECVRLEPKDIGLLPMTAWPLGNNSFVLHSYCNFRHLLFAKKLTREGCEYYLMVPGTLNARERQLAKMFGFENFKCSRRRSMRDGEFGYWYIAIFFN